MKREESICKRRGNFTLDDPFFRIMSCFYKDVELYHMSQQ